MSVKARELDLDSMTPIQRRLLLTGLSDLDLISLVENGHCIDSVPAWYDIANELAVRLKKQL